MEKYKQIKDILAAADTDAEKFYNQNNKAAGTRLRKAMLELKNIAQEVRKEVLEIKK
ncbi:MAG: histone H1 [Bacteroidota bacterium]